ncbi:indolepyruvate oxidoreductase subunit beta [Eubacteriales bacterium OttesenSCG-928-M02]|nr:indolepyruvate oxidoreductase subunit beta [Eubacteriales bacterium OttesenSCG-928-M02]
MEQNVLIAGVGGQGILLVGKILGTYAQLMGLDVKVSEVHGMAQRGGCVVTHVRMGDGMVHSPLIDKGQADAILSLEPMEALRYLDYLKEGGAIITARDAVPPVAVSMGNAVYPADVEAQLKAHCSRILVVDGATLAKEAGSLMALNIVLLGAYTAQMGLDRAAMERAVEQSVKQQYIKLNQVAFGLGYDLAV